MRLKRKATFVVARASALAAAGLLWLLPVFWGCAGSTPECRVGADCVSGVCLSNGKCQPPPDGAPPDGDAGPQDGDAADGGEDAADGTSDGGPDAGPEDGADGGPDAGDGGDGMITCTPEHNGEILRSEVPIRAGMHATFLIAADVPVNTAGESRPDDTRFWDLTAQLSGDHSVLVELRPLTGLWFAPEFPGATYAAQLRDDSNLLGVFEASDDALLLRGVASPQDDYTRTLLKYSEPIRVLSFPLRVGAAWTSESVISGQASGVYSYYYEKYENQVDARGELATPYDTFPVLRIRVSLTRTVGTVVTTSRSFVFVTECFGSIAAIHSRDYESEVEFTRASEVRRLSP
ncbi:MAG: hypothetical protein GYA21_16645 [Myxococcales bacterium]|nr:hypothetical protein [Myxococcales bacterium]